MLSPFLRFKPLAIKLRAREVGPTKATSSGWQLSSCDPSLRPSLSASGYTSFSWSPVAHWRAELAMASATRPGNGESPASARKMCSRATGNSWRRRSSLVRRSVRVISSKLRKCQARAKHHLSTKDQAGARSPSSGRGLAIGTSLERGAWGLVLLRKSLRISEIPGLKAPHDGVKSLEIAKVEADDHEADAKGDEEVETAREPLGQEANLARAFLLIILLKTTEGVVELAADFSAGILIGEKLREAGGGTEDFGGGSAGVELGTPS